MPPESVDRLVGHDPCRGPPSRRPPPLPALGPGQAYCGVPIIPLFGHADLRERLEESVRQGTLPASLLLHGPQGVGKQRLALHVAQALLCTGPQAPCGACAACRYALELTHPDLHWYFPRPRLETDPPVAEIEADLAEAIQGRAADGGLYAAPPGNEGLFVATVRAMLQRASLSPALGRRKVIIVGDAERMVAQEGAEYAANAFLKLLEEPPADTTLILTSSEPGALLPTIRSRVVAVRVPALPAEVVRRFFDEPAVRAFVAREDKRNGRDVRPEDRLRDAGGSPGRLLECEDGPKQAAERLLEAAASGSRARWLRAAFSLGVAGARAGYASTLEALEKELHTRLRTAVERGRGDRALALTRTMLAVEAAKQQARQNVNPQLAGSVLLRELAGPLGVDR